MTTGIVVGAGGGIGSACVRALAASCDLIVLVGRRREPLLAAAEHANGAKTAVVQADVTEAAGREAIVAAVDGAVSWVVLASGAPMRKPLVDLTDDEIELVFGANLVGPTLLLRRLLQLPWAEPAAIVAIGSISASRSLPQRSVYAASKAGVEHLARSLAAEVAPSGIRVNVVAPGAIATPFIGDSRDAVAAWAQERVPLARLGTSDEVANAVRYAVLDAPRYLTGARIAVDGGAEALA